MVFKKKISSKQKMIVQRNVAIFSEIFHIPVNFENSINDHFSIIS